MAGGNHTNAYATAQPNRFSLADTIAQQDQLNMHQQEQKRREQLLEEQRRDKLFERDEKLRERLLKIPQNYDTGSGSLNELQGRIIMQAINRKGEIYNQLRSGKISDSERVKLEIENQTLDNLPSNLKVATQNFTKLIGDYKKGVDDGSFFRNVDFESKVLNGFDNYLGSIDENGFPLIGFKDVNGDGKMDLMPWDNLKDGVGVWDFQKKISLDKLIDETAKGLGTEKTQTVNGFTKRTTKGIPVKLAQEAANSLIYDTDGNYKPVVYSYLRENGLNYTNPTPEDIKKIEVYTAQRILNSKDKEDITEVDNSAAIAAARLAYQKQQDAAAKAEKQKETKNSISYIDNNTGATYPFKNTDSFSFNKPFDLNNTKLGKLHKNGYLSSITIEDGKITLHGEEVKSQSKKTISTKKGEKEVISKDNWEPLSVTNKSAVQNILGNVLGTSSYDESVKKIKEIKKSNYTEQNMNNNSKEEIVW